MMRCMAKPEGAAVRWRTLLKRPIFIAVLLAAVLALAPSNALADDTTFVKGQCAPESHIAEGAIGEDLTKRQSRFFCDAAVVTYFSDNPKHVMIQFTESKSTHARQIGYAGMMNDAEIMNVDKVYLESGRPSMVVDGYCKFFFKEKTISGISCGAKIDEDGRRTVPIVGFNADLSSAPAQPQSSTDGNEPIPYDKSGVANCSLPGTIIEFALNGRGGAQVARIESNYPPFRNAARQTRVWRAGLVGKDAKRILVLDNGRKTRIMISLPDGKGIAFSADGGVSDILCQVLVNP
jgi:hypothetical protein